MQSPEKNSIIAGKYLTYLIRRNFGTDLNWRNCKNINLAVEEKRNKEKAPCFFKTVHVLVTGTIILLIPSIRR